jgi:hypothetical protein
LFVLLCVLLLKVVRRGNCCAQLLYSSFSYYNFSVGCVWQSFGSRDITTDD